MTIGRLMSNHAHKLRKSCESLLGICAGIIADDTLNAKEVRYLEQWLNDNADLAAVWPGSVLARRIGEALADGIVTDDELTHLKQVISDMVGGTLQETGAGYP